MFCIFLIAQCELSMLFQSYRGKVFNSIKLEHYLNRLGLSAEEYTVCVESDGELYIVLGDEDRHKCISKANKFANKHKVSVVVRYFKRESADKLINNIVCRVEPRGKNYSPKSKKNSRSAQNTKPEINKEESKKELDVYLNNYLNSLNKSNSDV